MKKLKSKKTEEFCEVPRWTLLKGSLNNLDYDTFLQKAREIENSEILDVRTEEEFLNWSISYAINLNYLSHNLADEVEKLDPSQYYFVYCRTGRRSSRICVILKNMGFKNVHNLEGGLVAWESKLKD